MAPRVPSRLPAFSPPRGITNFTAAGNLRQIDAEVGDTRARRPSNPPAWLRVEPVAEPVEQPQPRVAAALVGVGPGERRAGQLDDRRAPRFRREGKRLGGDQSQPRTFRMGFFQHVEEDLGREPRSTDAQARLSAPQDAVVGAAWDSDLATAAGSVALRATDRCFVRHRMPRIDRRPRSPCCTQEVLGAAREGTAT
jgi:hypothetical protein